MYVYLRGEPVAPLCRYTGVTRKVPFNLRPKDRKKVSDGYWGNRGIKFEKTEQLLSPSENRD